MKPVQLSGFVITSLAPCKQFQRKQAHKLNNTQTNQLVEKCTEDRLDWNPELKPEQW